MVKMIKRTFGTMLMLVMLATMLCVTAFAAPPAYPYLAVGNAVYTDLAVGSEVKIPVSLANLPSGDYLSGFSCHLDNTEYLTVKDVEFTAETASWSGGYNSDTKNVNKVQLSFATNPDSAKWDNGLLFTIVYTVANEIPAGTPVNPSISGVMLSKTSEEFLNSATGGRPTEAEKNASIVYPDSGSINVPEPASFTVNVSASPAAVYMNETVTVEVSVNGGVFTGAFYTLTYDTDKFELVSKPTDANAVGSNGFKHTYLAYNAADGTVIGTYTFKALAQDTEVTGNFTLGDYATVETNESSLGGNETPATVGSPAPVTINLIPNDPNGLRVSAADVEKEYDGNAYGVTATANKDGAIIRYQDTNGHYTLTESPVYSAVGEYTVYFKASLKGYEDAYGSAKVNIKAPAYKTEATEYVAGYSLVLVYTNQSGLNFTYDGRAMYDVTAAGYSLEGQAYSHVYGIVVQGNADMTKLAYAVGTATRIGYSTDINASGTTDLKDAINTVAVYNADSAYMADKMMLVLRADVDHSKTVDNADTTLVLDAINRG